MAVEAEDVERVKKTNSRRWTEMAIQLRKQQFIQNTPPLSGLWNHSTHHSLKGEVKITTWAVDTLPKYLGPSSHVSGHTAEPERKKTPSHPLSTVRINISRFFSFRISMPSILKQTSTGTRCTVQKIVVFRQFPECR